MAKTRAIDLRVLLVLVAGLLAAAALWAGTSWAGGSGGQSSGSTPAQTGDGGLSFTQSGGSGDDGRDCPEKGPGGEGPSTSQDSAETAV